MIVSPYLQRRLRSLDEVIGDAAAPPATLSKDIQQQDRSDIDGKQEIAERPALAAERSRDR